MIEFVTLKSMVAHAPCDLCTICSPHRRNLHILDYLGLPLIVYGSTSILFYTEIEHRKKLYRPSRSFKVIQSYRN